MTEFDLVTEFETAKILIKNISENIKKKSSNCGNTHEGKLEYATVSEIHENRRIE